MPPIRYQHLNPKNQYLFIMHYKETNKKVNVKKGLTPGLSFDSWALPLFRVPSVATWLHVVTFPLFTNSFLLWCPFPVSTHPFFQNQLQTRFSVFFTFSQDGDYKDVWESLDWRTLLWRDHMQFYYREDLNYFSFKSRRVQHVHASFFTFFFKFAKSIIPVFMF